MKRLNFGIIVALMGISLIGIILMQLIWMTNALRVKENHFNQMAQYAITRSLFRVEQTLLSDFNGGLRQPPPNQILPENMVTPETKPLIVDPQSSNEPPSANNAINLNDSLLKTAPTYSVYALSRPSEAPIRHRRANSEDDNHPPFPITKKIQDIPAEERLNPTIVAPLLKFELDKSGIPLAFEYAFTDYRGQIYQNLSTPGFNLQKVKAIYTAPVCPIEMGPSTDIVLLYFPEKTAYIYKGMIGQMTGSLLFTLIILFTFYYTLRTIFNQKKLSEMKSDFINNMTHEFKTPIATISLAADSISNPITLADTDKILRFTNIIKEENRRMNRQVESVLKMALIDKKDLDLNLVVCQAHPVIEKAVQNMMLQIEQKQGKIQLQLTAEHDVVKVDIGHFENVIFNLIDNAIKYTLEKSPEITIATFVTEGWFHLSVTDNGIGMDKDTQERVFEKFYRHSTGNVHTIKGFGLGLSYVKAMVLSFKGDIAIKSTKGTGSTFTIKLPLKKEI